MFILQKLFSFFMYICRSNFSTHPTFSLFIFSISPLSFHFPVSENLTFFYLFFFYPFFRYSGKFFAFYILVALVLNLIFVNLPILYISFFFFYLHPDLLPSMLFLFFTPPKHSIYILNNMQLYLYINIK